MTPEQHARIEQRFQEALTLTADQRSEFLQRSEPDPQVRAAVERLLAHCATQDPSDPLRDRMAEALRAMAAAPQTPLPQTIGAYRLLRELGSGGMGTVYLAERAAGDGVQRVALKLLHGPSGDTAQRRMARERGLLASLDHPLIARHIDGGTSEQGQPYLVMDYIDGASLHEHLTQAPGGLRERLQLFLRLCEAVDHAHRRLVLHRDLKPSNVIVRGDGAPVLLDFGIATLIDADDGPARTVTVAFTPGYSAPEQRRGEAATTATDVFGLGALLFDLVTGRRLSELRGRDAAVPVPSASVEAGALRRTLRGDLDRIVSTACAEAPGERYPSVAALADDVRRHLDGQPVLAAHGGTVYRLRKFIGRHRLATAASVLAVLMASGFVWRLNDERERAVVAERTAQAARERAEQETQYTQASRKFLESVLAETAPDEVRGAPVSVSALLARAADELQADTRQDPRTRAIAWLTIAEVQDAIRDPQASLRAVDAATAAMAQLDPDDPELRARLLGARGSALQGMERPEQAMAAHRELLTLRQRQGADATTLGRAYVQYIASAIQANQDQEVERAIQRATAVLDAAGEAAPELRLELAIAEISPALAVGDLPRAERHLLRARAMAAPVWPADHPGRLILHRLAGQLRGSQLRHDQALREVQEGLRIARTAFGERSRNTMEMENELGGIYHQMGRLPEAVEHSERALRIGVDLGLDPRLLAKLQIDLASVYGESMGQPERAIELLDQALQWLQGYGDEPDVQPWRMRALSARAMSLVTLKRDAAALPDYEAAMALARDHADSKQLISIQLRMVRPLIRERRYERAQQLLDEAEDRVAKGPAEHKNFVPGLLALKADLAFKRGDLALASQRVRQALDAAAASPAYDPLMIANVQLMAAEIAHARGERRSARELLEHATAAYDAGLPPGAVQRVRAEQLRRKLSG
ncbi:serine/threonine-protein kinase [Lysobacter silvisoli]|uniref:Protein kinase domain-containing protein n=1 Tax=Lysobacter silvisoli TaxID=2293254 RepID=A0A371JYB7_9GAMM|nr:serine/threonine-protein kinase [Lysobacter silvisoli]RDZ26612.1 hypothetical protein DX914_16655 [Lysobacter silvisoli]